MTPQIRTEKDYVIEVCKLVAYNGKEYPFVNHYVYFTYEENIFTGIHGSMFVIDAVDYPTLMPMIGEERFICQFTRQDETSKTGELLPPISFNMPIYKLSGRQQESGSRKGQTYTLFYTTDEVVKNTQTKVLRTFDNIPYSEMVKIIYDEYLKIKKEIFVEQTKYNQNYVVSNEPPYYAIKKISSRSISAQDNGSLYLFYEDRDRFNFVTAEYLFEQEPKHEFYYGSKELRERSRNSANVATHYDKEIEFDMYNVDHHHQSNTYSILDSIQSGHGAQKLITVDPIRRKINTKDFNLNNEYNTFKHIDKSKPFTENSKFANTNPEAVVHYVCAYQNHEDSPYIKEKLENPMVNNNYADEYLIKRKSQYMQLFRHIITIKLSGDPRVKAGDTIIFHLPENLGKMSEQFPEEKDKYLQGKYLVAGVAHVVRRERYEMNLELIKDSFFSEIEHRDPIEEYKNIK